MAEEVIYWIGHTGDLTGQLPKGYTAWTLTGVMSSRSLTVTMEERYE